MNESLIPSLIGGVLGLALALDLHKKRLHQLI